jgi:uncharacterized membrane protein YesL
VERGLSEEPLDDEETDDGGGWSGRLMGWLRVAGQLVGINLLMVLGSLAGLLLLGTFPALAAGGLLLADLAAGRPSERVWAEFWTEWRAGLVRMNVLGAPWWAVGGLVLLDLQAVWTAPGPVARVLAGGVLLLILYLAVVFAFFLAATRRYDEPIGRTWRFLLVAPLLAPATSLAIIVLDCLLAWAFSGVTVLVPLAGLALPVLATGWLADRRLDRQEDRSGGSPSVDSQATIS